MSFNLNEEVKAFLQEAADDGVTNEQAPYELQGYLKALASIKDSGDIYRKSQDIVWVKDQVVDSGVTFTQKT